MWRFSYEGFRAACTGAAVLLAGCSVVPNSGPSSAQISRVQSQSNAAGVQIVNLTDSVARQLFAERRQADFDATLGDTSAFQQQLGIGDTIEVSIWEAPPATLFGAGPSDGKGEPSSAHVTVLPDQVIDGGGNVSVPFIGVVKAAGLTPGQLEKAIAGRLAKMAHEPQVLVRLSRNATSYVTVVGDVTTSNRMALTARGERLLDALANAGGVREAIDKVTIQVTRGKTVTAMPLASVIRDPKQNIPLHAGDVVTALFQPYSFTVLGATGKNEEINFEAQGITLAQALARSGGLSDARSDARGVFIFRFADVNALQWPTQPVRRTVDGKVPVVFHVDLRDPNSFFVVQNFIMDNKDVLYVSNAPVTELQKVLNLFFSVAYPIVTGVQTFR